MFYRPFCADWCEMPSSRRRVCGARPPIPDVRTAIAYECCGRDKLVHRLFPISLDRAASFHFRAVPGQKPYGNAQRRHLSLAKIHKTARRIHCCTLVYTGLLTQQQFFCRVVTGVLQRINSAIFSSLAMSCFTASIWSLRSKALRT
jgi:hypothetical protein